MSFFQAWGAEIRGIHYGDLLSVAKVRSVLRLSQGLRGPQGGIDNPLPCTQGMRSRGYGA